MSVELEFWILIVSGFDSGFLELYSGSQSLRFRIPQAKVSQKTSRIPESRFPYMGRSKWVYTPSSMSYEGNNRAKREAATRTGQEHAQPRSEGSLLPALSRSVAAGRREPWERGWNTLHAKQRPPKFNNSIKWLKHHNLNHHYDYYRTISKIISGILTMVYSAVNHSYDSNRTITIISGNITMIYYSQGPCYSL